MRVLWLFLILPAVLGQAGFGRSYLKNSRLCHQWNCINTKLGFPDYLPDRDLATSTLRNVLPIGVWQDTVEKVLDGCYGNRTRRYTNTCPGQALLHCIVDQLNYYCPEESQRKRDACSPVSSLAGLKYMFSQSRYFNLEENLPRERRPEWFLKNYFDQKCCQIPVMFNSTVLQECGFTSFVAFYDHESKYKDAPQSITPVPVTPTNNDNVLKVVDFNLMQTPTLEDISNTDPLDCCDMKEFMQPSWRSDCGFHVRWTDQDRLVITNNTSVFTTEAPITTTARSIPAKDLMLVPQSCDAESCVFQKLGILTSDRINTLAFMKLLDNFTDSNPVWKKATARVVTKCLSRKVHDYDGTNDCEINKVLACALDILTENCPYKRRMDDACRHHKQKNGCQISSSKYRPKNRREVCLLPQLVNQYVLHECGLDSLYKAEHVIVPEIRPKKIGWAAGRLLCQEQKPSTTCLMSKMGILNRYKFMDYFGMKNKIRQFMNNQTVWSAGLDLYMSAFINIPLYDKHCSSQKKLLNVIDAMLMTCPISKRVDTPQCIKIFKDMTDSTPMIDPRFSKPQLDEILKHYHHIFLPSQPMTTKFDWVIRHRRPQFYRKRNHNYGVLDTRGSPKVNVIAVKPALLTPRERPVVLPQGSALLATPFYNDGVLRGNPFWLHDRIANARFTTQVPNISTVYPVPTNVPSTTAKNLPTIPTFTEPAWTMIKPE